MTNLPSGTITFLFTDLSDSTRLWEKHPSEMGLALQRHDQIIEETAQQHQGFVVRPRGEGDSRFLVFERAIDGVQAAAAIQGALHKEDWPGDLKLYVRMAVHTGEGKFRDGDYYGPAVNRCANLRSIAHGGQVLISQVVCELVQDILPEDIELFDLGENPLKDMMRPEQIYQLMAPGLQINFPPLSLDQRQLEYPTKPPPFLDLDLDEDEVTINRPVFVAREHELSQLFATLEKVVSGYGQVLFITGGAGRGKTVLLDEFCSRAQDQFENLITVRGNCSSHTGVGDPYLPFRDITGLLTGDVEASLSAGSILPEHAKRLWNLLPHTVDALLKRGPSLIDVLVHGEALLARTESASPENVKRLRQLKEIVERNKKTPTEMDQNLLFEQFTNILRILGKGAPLLLFIDDLQWADQASIDLLNHLGRRIEGHPILIIGAYRPDEVALGRDGERHPLENVVNELKRLHGEISLDLGEEDREEDFIDLYLDTEPNDLSPEFRQTLKDHTKGHPLFTVELLREMQDRGDLIKDEDERWVEGPAISWEKLPARVEAVIEERVERLDDDLKELLSIASVEGEEFTVQVVAKVKKVREKTLHRKLSQQLERDHRLVHERDEVKSNGKILSRYRFRHQLYQHYLYNDLSAGERRLMHGDIATALEDLHQEETRGVAVQLAHHYSEAKEITKASKYLLEAAELAKDLGANIESLNTIGKIESFGLEVDLNIRIQALEVKNFILHNIGDYETCLPINEKLVELTNEAQDYNRIAEAHFLHGDTLHYLGNLKGSVEALDQSIASAQKANNKLIEAKAIGYKLLPLTRLGEIENATKLAKKAIILAETANDDLVLARNLTNASFFYGYSGDLSKAVEMLLQQQEITRRIDFMKGRAIGLANLGFIYVMLGMYPEAIKSIEQAIEISIKLGYMSQHVHNCWNLCLAYLRMGDSSSAMMRIKEVENEIVGKGILESYHQFYYGLVNEAKGEDKNAIANFVSSYKTFLEIDLKAHAFDSLAGKARCLQQLGQIETAGDTAHELWGYLNETGASGMELPILSYLTCAEIFKEIGDMEKYNNAVNAGYQLLMNMADKISDLDMRQSYLDNVPEHTKILKLYQEN